MAEMTLKGLFGLLIFAIAASQVVPIAVNSIVGANLTGIYLTLFQLGALVLIAVVVYAFYDHLS